VVELPRPVRAWAIEAGRVGSRIPRFAITKGMPNANLAWGHSPSGKKSAVSGSCETAKIGAWWTSGIRDYPGITMAVFGIGAVGERFC